MKRGELREGSLLYYGVEGKICKVVGIGSEAAFDGLIETESDGVLNAEREIDFFIPIPLTEAWLERNDLLCYYGSPISNKVYKIDQTTFSYVVGVVYDTAFYDDGIDSPNAVEVEVKYVHQLQNLYHALTGEEPPL